MLLDEGEKGVQFFSRIDNFNNDGEIFSQAFDFEGVDDSGVGPEPHESPVDRRTGELLAVRLRDDPFVERLPLVFVALSGEDSQKTSVFSAHRSFPYEKSGGVAEPDGDEAQDGVADDISAGQHELPVAQQIHRFVAEGREGGKTAEYADDEERPGLPRNDTSMIGELRNKPDHCASHEVDGQRAEGELNALAELLDISAHEVTQD